MPAGLVTPACKTLTGSHPHVQGAQESAGSEGDTGDLEEMQALRDRVLQLQVRNGPGSPGLQPASNTTMAMAMRHDASRPACRLLITCELLTAPAALPLAAAPCKSAEMGRRCSRWTNHEADMLRNNCSRCRSKMQATPLRRWQSWRCCEHGWLSFRWGMGCTLWHADSSTSAIS